MDSPQHQNKPAQTEAPTPFTETETSSSPLPDMLMKSWDDPRLSRVQRQQTVQRMGALLGNRATQQLLQRRRTRHEGVQDNGILNRPVTVVLGNISGILPQGIYVEVIANEGSQLRVKVWSGYGGQETDIPSVAFDQTPQRDDEDIDNFDVGAYANIPESQRIPVAQSAQMSHRRERHDGVLDNGRLSQTIAYIQLGGATGSLPANTYIEVIRVNPDGSRTIRVWSGYGGRETTIPASIPWATIFQRVQLPDHQMNIPDLVAYNNVPLTERLPLADSVRLQVIDNGVLTAQLETTSASVPLLPADTYVEVMEYRDAWVVLRPHSGYRSREPHDQFITADRSAFQAVFRHQPQLTEQRRGRQQTLTPHTVREDLTYQRYPAPTGSGATATPGYVLWNAGGPSVSDIDQDQLGSCYLLASAGALINQNPATIQNQVFGGNSPTADTFQVHLHRIPNLLMPSAATTPPTPIIVTVDRYLPTRLVGGTIYAGMPNRVLWPAVLEKAFAEAFSGYDNMDRGSWGNTAMRILTGNSLASDPHSPQDLVPSALTTSALLARLRVLTPPHTAATFSCPRDVRSLNLLGPHEYIFEFVDGSNHVILTNPHGENHPRPLTMAQVRQHINRITFRK
jgi:hypothetical protein